MSNIKIDCDIIQNHIKKSKSYLSIFMYTTNGVMFMLMSPFVNLHKKHFNKVKEYVKVMNTYSKEYNLDINFNSYFEIDNSAIMYSQSQLDSLTIKQYELIIEYLDNLSTKVESLRKLI